MLLTSIRRSLSNLKAADRVETTGRIKERLGASNTTYRITKEGERYLWAR